MCEIIMIRNMREDWECDQETGEMESCGFMGDGGVSEFDSYSCEDHGECFDTWEEAKAHKQEQTA